MIGHFVEHFTYAGLFLALLAGSVGVPIPEEVAIIAGGVLAHEEVVRWWLALPVCIVGVLSGDIILYWAGHHWGLHVLAWRPVRYVLTIERAQRLLDAYRQHGAKIVAVARHVAGLRAPAFLMAGTARIPFGKFLAIDGASALVGVSFSFGIAYFLTDHLKEIMGNVHRVGRWIAVIAIVVGIATLLIIVRRKSRDVLGPPGDSRSSST